METNLGTAGLVAGMCLAPPGSGVQGGKTTLQQIAQERGRGRDLQRALGLWELAPQRPEILL